MTVGIEYIVFAAVSICSLLAIGSIPIALREAPPRSFATLGTAYGLMAITWLLYIALPRGNESPDYAVILRLGFGCASMICLWAGIWQRTGHSLNLWFFGFLVGLWMIPGVLIPVLDLNLGRTIAFVGLTCAIGTASCVHRLWYKVGSKNAGDKLLLGLLTLALPLLLYGANLGFRSTEENVQTSTIFFLAIVPIQFAGIGLFLFQSYALDAIGEMTRRARTDPLTGIMNRRAFDEELTVALARANRYGRPLALIITDIDHFKRINDQYGHPFGDRVIRELAQMLAHESREVDLVARIGGEEFAVVVPEIGTDQAALFAERLRVAATEIRVGEGNLSASFGVASTETSDYSGSALIRDADSALYIAKQQGRNQVRTSGAAEVTLARSKQSPATS